MCSEWKDGSAARRSARAGVRALAVALTLAATALAAGCGDAGTTASGSRAGDTLTIATPSFPPSLDPATGANEHGDYFNLAYDPLIVQAPDGSFKPGLATRWKYGPRNESFSLTLRRGVRFSDGTPLNAAAVKTWIEHAMRLPGGRATTYLSALKAIDVTGPLAVTFRFDAPTPLLELVFSQVLEMGMIGSPKAVAADTLATSTAGAGPYMLDTASTVTRDHYTYVPNPHYWNKPAIHWDKVVIKTIASPTAALQALRTGQVQVVKDQPVTNIAAAESAGLEYVDPLTLLMALSLMDRDGKLAEPLGDVRVRQAINHAIDRQAITKVLGAGFGRPITQMAAPGDDSYDAALEQRYPYDPVKARELLAEAGYADGFTLPVVSIAAVGQDRLGQALAGQLEKVGVRLELDVKATNDDYVKGMASARFPAATLSFGRLPAAIDYKVLWGPGAALFNPFRTSSPQLTRLDARLSAADARDSGAIAREMQRFLVEQAWFAPVLATPLVVLYSDDVTGVVATARRNVVYTPEIKPAD